MSECERRYDERRNRVWNVYHKRNQMRIERRVLALGPELSKMATVFLDSLPRDGMAYERRIAFLDILLAMKEAR